MICNSLLQVYNEQCHSNNQEHSLPEIQFVTFDSFSAIKTENLLDGPRFIPSNINTAVKEEYIIDDHNTIDRDITLGKELERDLPNISVAVKEECITGVSDSPASNTFTVVKAELILEETQEEQPVGEVLYETCY